MTLLVCCSSVPLLPVTSCLSRIIRTWKLISCRMSGGRLFGQGPQRCLPIRHLTQLQEEESKFVVADTVLEEPFCLTMLGRSHSVSSLMGWQCLVLHPRHMARKLRRRTHGWQRLEGGRRSGARDVAYVRLVAGRMSGAGSDGKRRLPLPDILRVAASPCSSTVTGAAARSRPLARPREA
jgi:hypothetical protein